MSPRDFLHSLKRIHVPEHVFEADGEVVVERDGDGGFGGGTFGFVHLAEFPVVIDGICFVDFKMTVLVVIDLDGLFQTC